MIRLVRLYLLVLILCGSAPRVDATELNLDYFRAAESPEALSLLRLVDTYHTDKVARSIRDGNMAPAIGDLKYTLDRFPNHPRALILMASVAQLMKMPFLASPYFERALALYPQYALTHAQYGSYLVDIGRIDEGISRLKRALEIDPRLAVAYAWLAKAYTKIGNLELAQQAAQQATAYGYKPLNSPTQRNPK